MHFEALILGLVGSDDWNNFIFFEKAFGQLKSKEVRTASDFIGLGYFLQSAIFVVNRIGPYKITKKSRLGYFHDSVDALNIVNLKSIKNYWLELGRNSTMNTQEFAVNKAGQRKTVEHTHDAIVDFLIIFTEA